MPKENLRAKGAEALWASFESALFSGSLLSGEVEYVLQFKKQKLTREDKQELSTRLEGLEHSLIQFQKDRREALIASFETSSKGSSVRDLNQSIRELVASVRALKQQLNSVRQAIEKSPLIKIVVKAPPSKEDIERERQHAQEAARKEALEAERREIFETVRKERASAERQKFQEALLAKAINVKQAAVQLISSAEKAYEHAMQTKMDPDIQIAQQTLDSAIIKIREAFEVRQGLVLETEIDDVATPPWRNEQWKALDLKKNALMAINAAAHAYIAAKQSPTMDNIKAAQEELARERQQVAKENSGLTRTEVAGAKDADEITLLEAKQKELETLAFKARYQENSAVVTQVQKEAMNLCQLATQEPSIENIALAQKKLTEVVHAVEVLFDTKAIVEETVLWSKAVLTWKDKTLQWISAKQKELSELKEQQKKELAKTTYETAKASTLDAEQTARLACELAIDKPSLSNIQQAERQLKVLESAKDKITWSILNTEHSAFRARLRDFIDEKKQALSRLKNNAVFEMRYIDSALLSTQKKLMEFRGALSAENKSAFIDAFKQLDLKVKEFELRYEGHAPEWLKGTSERLSEFKKEVYAQYKAACALVVNLSQSAKTAHEQAIKMPTDVNIANAAAKESALASAIQSARDIPHRQTKSHIHLMRYGHLSEKRIQGLQALKTEATERMSKVEEKFIEVQILFNKALEHGDNLESARHAFSDLLDKEWTLVDAQPGTLVSAEWRAIMAARLSILNQIGAGKTIEASVLKQAEKEVEDLIKNAISLYQIAEKHPSIKNITAVNALLSTAVLTVQDTYTMRISTESQDNDKRAVSQSWRDAQLAKLTGLQQAVSQGLEAQKNTDVLIKKAETQYAQALADTSYPEETGQALKAAIEAALSAYNVGMRFVTGDNAILTEDSTSIKKYREAYESLVSKQYEFSKLQAKSLVSTLQVEAAPLIREAEDAYKKISVYSTDDEIHEVQEKLKRALAPVERVIPALDRVNVQVEDKNFQEWQRSIKAWREEKFISLFEKYGDAQILERDIKAQLEAETNYIQQKLEHYAARLAGKDSELVKKSEDPENTSARVEKYRVIQSLLAVMMTPLPLDTSVSSVISTLKTKLVQIDKIVSESAITLCAQDPDDHKGFIGFFKWLKSLCCKSQSAKKVLKPLQEVTNKYRNIIDAHRQKASDTSLNNKGRPVSGT
ncbi:MAG: hypothetical protein Q8R79_01520 [Legionellaceae bacterium]|nr:hypothetical protein [Legionellaceae bacterium]